MDGRAEQLERDGESHRQVKHRHKYRHGNKGQQKA
jgi:hypothetical protein